MILAHWALKWGVPFAALRDLENCIGLEGAGSVPEDMRGTSEAAAQAAVMREAPQRGVRLWRNNVGALKDESGRVVRYGLANSSAAENKIIKSGDLIGVRPVTIQQAHVGHVIGQFVSREIKEPGWKYTGSGREEAQLRWIHLVNACGGDAQFATGAGTL